MMGRFAALRRHKRVCLGHEHRLQAGALAAGGRSDSLAF
jgi:hypothetical protein